MAKSAAEIFNDKVRLIFEYNNQSPLFVKVANTEIENNNIDSAIGILNEGIKTYPRYATAFFLLGRAYILAGNYSSALKQIKKGSDLICSKKTYDFYFNELENNKKQRSVFQSSSRNIFLPEQGKLDERKEVENSGSKNGFDENGNQSVDDRLDQIAKDISNAKIPEAAGTAELQDNLLPGSTGSMIVSETLARIYIAQGELKEAIEVYRKLIKKDSSKEKYYLGKINELKTQLES